MQMKEIEWGGGGGFLNLHKLIAFHDSVSLFFFVHTLAFSNTYYLEESNTAKIDKPRH
jgi:hypothetical protein